MPVGFPVPSSHPDSAHTVTCKCHSNRDRNQSRLLRETVMAAASTAPVTTTRSLECLQR